ncbi:MAG: FIST C-terminal domain-containing protein [Peptococcaceae bacterium]|nr:FIST C-terminal domain-containing protein [Peptococcaceae bacterium]
MIKTFTAHTREIDDMNIAVTEILEQLKPERNCLKNSVAIVSCYREFAENGIAAELHRRLKFPVIGTSTYALATNKAIGEMDLAVLMITADDVTFTAACSPPLENDLTEPFTQMYQSALAGHNEQPKLIFSAAPFLIGHAGDHYIEILNMLSGGVPNFGAFAVDNEGFQHCYVIFNDQVEKDIYAIIVASGNIEPHFAYSSTIFLDYALSQKVPITKYQGNLVQEVNGLHFTSFMESLGLDLSSHSGVLYSPPFMLNCTDKNHSVSRVLVSLNEDGYAICGGLVPENADVCVGSWDKFDVIDTTTQVINKLLSNEKVNAILLYSCSSRGEIFGREVLIEADKVHDTLADKYPYLFTYSGGEICPADNGSMANCFHNNTIIACAF